MKLSSHAGRAAIIIAIAAMLPFQSAGAAPADPKPGSLYLQCDGKPNNMTSGESAARLLGAVTLLALFAPPPESADSSKRKFGAEGVAACTEILDGDKKEGNPSRRISLILGRAIHRIEQKDYEAAIADTKLARQEATAAGLMANPYYTRSEARGFDLIESAALFRLGRAADAREAALRNAGSIKHSVVPLILLPDYLDSVRTGSDAETNFLTWRTRSEAVAARSEADRLEELGRFTDAADVREALVDFDRASTPEAINSDWLAQAAVSLALAGRKELAAQRATEARANFDKRTAEGKPESDAAKFVELMDLYGIIQTANAGDVKTARRLFAARSQWVAASFGSVIEMTRRLRAGAAPDDLIGGLAHDPEQMWKERAEATKAKMIVTDSSNKNLFFLIPAVSTAGSYEALSKRIWRVEKSDILLKPSASEARKNNLETLFLYGGDAITTMEAYTLHAALLAKSRGQQGFVITPLFDKNILAAFIMTGNRGAPGFAAPLFNDADEVIADLSPLFPSPETLKARRAAH